MGRILNFGLFFAFLFLVAIFGWYVLYSEVASPYLVGIDIISENVLGVSTFNDELDYSFEIPTQHGLNLLIQDRILASENSREIYNMEIPRYTIKKELTKSNDLENDPLLVLPWTYNSREAEAIVYCDIESTNTSCEFIKKLEKEDIIRFDKKVYKVLKIITVENKDTYILEHNREEEYLKLITKFIQNENIVYTSEYLVVIAKSFT